MTHSRPTQGAANCREAIGEISGCGNMRHLFVVSLALCLGVAVTWFAAVALQDYAVDHRHAAPLASMAPNVAARPPASGQPGKWMF